MSSTILRIGTRGSPLALAQAYDVKNRLLLAHGWTDEQVVVQTFTTTGDQVQDKPLTEIGGKGLFTKELEEALYRGDIDIAVHSMKDVATILPPNLVISCVLAREAVEDVLLGPYESIQALPPGSVVGTSSVRRAAQLRHLRPDIQIVGFRGNVQTRLKKLEEGIADATFLARAGLNRLGMNIGNTISSMEMLPAVAQGAVGIECHTDDDKSMAFLTPLHDETTSICVSAERAFLRKLDGSCRTPIAGSATFYEGEILLRGEAVTIDGSRKVSLSGRASASDAEMLGTELAEKLLGHMGPDFLKLP